MDLHGYQMLKQQKRKTIHMNLIIRMESSQRHFDFSFSVSYLLIQQFYADYCLKAIKTYQISFIVAKLVQNCPIYEFTVISFTIMVPYLPQFNLVSINFSFKLKINCLSCSQYVIYSLDFKISQFFLAKLVPLPCSAAKCTLVIRPLYIFPQAL